MRNLFLAVIFFGATLWASNYQIDINSPKGATSLKTDRLVYIESEAGMQILSADMASEIQPARVYLRRKISNQQYGWYPGVLKDNGPENLYVFDVQSLGFSPAQLKTVKMYPRLRAKAFRDEKDIYFDNRFLYSPRLRTIHFFVGEKWYSLDANDAKNGALNVKSMPDSATVLFEGQVLGVTPLTTGGFRPGNILLQLRRQGYQRSNIPVRVLPGVLLSVEENLLESQKADYEFLYPVSRDQILQASTVPVLDSLLTRLDKEILNLQKVESKLTPEFEKVYPPAKAPAPGVDPEKDEDYQKYLKAWKEQKEQARRDYLSVVITANDSVLAKRQVVEHRLDSIEALLMTWKTRPGAFRYRVLDSLIGRYELQMRLQSQNGEHDLTWRGYVVLDSLKPDSVFGAMADSSSDPSVLVKFQNKAVKIPTPNGKMVRRFYRYRELGLVMDSTVKVVPGQFMLPKYILEQDEVQRWIHGDSAKVTKETIEAQQEQKESANKLREEKLNQQKELIRQYRGDVVEIPEGRFRYKGKMVRMTPYAIHQTEVTQGHYERIMVENRSADKGYSKPVTNVTWYQADEFCKEIGGFLPSEARWEYAARAGKELTVYWKGLNTKGKAGAYAVYDANSKMLGQSNPDYGVHRVKSKLPNQWEIYDMLGNVSEWTGDKYSILNFFVNSTDPKGAMFGHFKIYKGASWQDSEKDLDAENYDYEDPRYWGDAMGFRCAFPPNQVVSYDEVKAILAQKDSLRIKRKFTPLRPDSAITIISNHKQGKGKPAQGADSLKTDTTAVDTSALQDTSTALQDTPIAIQDTSSAMPDSVNADSVSVKQPSSVTADSLADTAATTSQAMPDSSAVPKATEAPATAPEAPVPVPVKEPASTLAPVPAAPAAPVAPAPAVAPATEPVPAPPAEPVPQATSQEVPQAKSQQAPAAPAPQQPPVAPATAPASSN